MKRSVWALLLVFVAAVLQGNIPSTFSILDAKPDLVLVVIIVYSLASNPISAATIGLLAGIVQGFSVGTSLGSFALTRMLTGFLAGFCTVHVFSENLLVPSGSALVLTAVCESAFLLVNPAVARGSVWKVIVGESVCNAIIVVAIYFVVRVCEGRRRNKLIDSKIY